ncbi:MAG: EAL domain-containing protein, partial [Lachnospiraceae bacterium]|nr:EAL domain-containing protein [Lachnospiraceae bacterium]
MKKYGIDPACINFEITESASLTAKNILLDNMKKLMDYGVRFSLDDFGTGHSNLNYVVDMPVNIVKFDKDMTNAYFENRKAKFVMEAAMHMIQGMHLDIVSEGIETQQQFETMQNLGIQYIQGFYFSKPLKKEDFLEFLFHENQ